MDGGDLARPIYPSGSWLIAFMVWTGPVNLCTIYFLATVHHRFLTNVIADVPPISRATTAWALSLWFAAIALFWLGYSFVRSGPANVPRSLEFHGPTVRGIGLGAGAIWLIVLVYSSSIGFGVLGRPVPSVPFPVRLVLSRGPLLLLASLIAAAGAMSSTRGRLVMVGTAVIPIALGSYLTTSRGGAAAAVLPFLLAEYCRATSRRTRRRVIASTALLVASLVLLYPVLSQRRGQLAFGAASSQGLPTALAQVALRPQGATGALYLTAGEVPSQPSFDAAGVVTTYTTDVVRVRIPNDFRSPGIVAGLYLFGGPLGLLVGLLALGALSAGTLRAARDRPLGLYAASFFFVRAMFFLSEGTLQPQDLVATALGVVAILAIGRCAARSANGLVASGS